MKPASLIIMMLMVVAQSLNAQLPVTLSQVPDSLKEHASVISLVDDSYFEVTDIDRAFLHAHEIVAVMNEAGKRALVFQEYSDKFRSLSDADIKVYDTNGKQTAHYRKRDMSMSGFSDGLIEDGETTYFVVSASSYPVIVEFDYEIKYKGILNYPSYYITHAGRSVLNSTFTAKIPAELGLRYRNRFTDIKPVIKKEDKYNLYTWSVKNLPAFDYEPGSVKQYSPGVTLAPTRFKYDRYAGDLSSWKTFGEWLNKLYDGQDELSDDRQAFFQDLVKDEPTEELKIKRIYNYMQDNFRYVSIQLGIGGLQPFPATFTDQKKYGDCKGLSNYMKAALKAIGVKSYVAIINAEYDSEPAQLDFPCNWFNHVILCVPREKDSIWLECTSKTAAFNILGTFTENKNALLVTEKGGVLVATPPSNPTENRFSMTTRVALQSDGAAVTQSSIHSTGSYQQMLDYVQTEKKDDQKRFIVHYLGFKQPDLFKLYKSEDPQHSSTLIDLEVEKVPDFVAGSKMFLRPRLSGIWTDELPDADHRRYDYYFEEPFEKEDTTIYQLPDGYIADALPKEKTLSCKYADYSTHYWYDESQKAVYSTASLRLKWHHIPAKEYADVKKFFDEVLKDESQRLVVKKE